MVAKAAITRNGSLASDSWKIFATPWNDPLIDAGTPIWLMVVSMVDTAVERETPDGRLNEMVFATRPSWWLTTSEVLSCPNRAKLDSGIIVSALVEPAVPVDDAVLPVAPIELVARLRTALAATELTELVSAADATVPATALVVCEPVAGPPDVLT